MLQFKHGVAATLVISVDDAYESLSEFTSISVTLQKQTTESSVTVDFTPTAFDCTRKILTLVSDSVIPTSISGEYKINVKNGVTDIYFGMIFVGNDDKTSGLNGIVIG